MFESEILEQAKRLIEADRFAETIALLERFLEHSPESADAADARKLLAIVRDVYETLPNPPGARISYLPDYWNWLERRRDDALFETLHRERVERLWPRRFVFEILLILEPGQEDLL
ncbi:MAG: hypothetical protein LBU43_05915, partial [Candidatus Accumulibacter sp.]|nr:hypothetical protein [Accumulibacter sp.]